MSKHDEYITTMETQLRKWDSDIDAMHAKGKTMAIDLRAGYFGRLKELRAHRQDAQRRFGEIRTASEEAATKLYEGMESAWESMRNGLTKASSDLSQPKQPD